MLLAWILINILCHHYCYLLDGQMVKKGVFDLIPNDRLGWIRNRTVQRMTYSLSFSKV